MQSFCYSIHGWMLNLEDKVKHTKILASFLKSKRQISGLSQKEVSDRLGYSTAQFISNWERGVSSPPMNILKKLAEIYKVSLEEFYDVLLQATIEEAKVDLHKKVFGSQTKKQIS